MSSPTTRTTSGGVGFLGLLTIAFIVLKLIGIITWSWAWVLAPLWIPIALAIAIFIVIGLLVLLDGVFSKGGKR